MPFRSEPLKEPVTLYSSFLSGAKITGIRSSASITVIGSEVYGLAVLTFAYLISAPTARAVFDGRVHGVVVHAIIFTPSVSMSRKRNSDRSLCFRLKSEIQVVSFTSR